MINVTVYACMQMNQRVVSLEWKGQLKLAATGEKIQQRLEIGVIRGLGRLTFNLY